MNNDLISRNEVLKSILEIDENVVKSSHDMRELIAIEIKRKSIAYDVDTVLKNLEKHKKEIEGRKERDILNTVAKVNARVAIEDDIEIVKSGFLTSN